MEAKSQGRKLDLLLTRRIPTGEIEIPGVGKVTVRGLSREEMIGIPRDDMLEAERKTLAFAMVDPPMTEDQVLEWQRLSQASEINAVTMKVNELSGITEGAAKESYKSVRS
jgi:hypothetical protein